MGHLTHQVSMLLGTHFLTTFSIELLLKMYSRPRGELGIISRLIYGHKVDVVEDEAGEVEDEVRLKRVL